MGTNATRRSAGGRVILLVMFWALACSAVSGIFYTHGDGNMLFHILVASLIVSQVSQDVLSIIFYRRGH